MIVFVSVAIILICTDFCFSYLPARRAETVDPMQALRTDSADSQVGGYGA